MVGAAAEATPFGGTAASTIGASSEAAAYPRGVTAKSISSESVSQKISFHGAKAFSFC